MSGKIVQVSPEPWPSGYGDVIATLDVSLEALADHYGLEFYEGDDNLGFYSAAVVRLPSGRRIGVLRHAGAPDAGVEVHADIHDNVPEAVQELLGAMDLPATSITWIRETAAPPDSAQIY